MGFAEDSKEEEGEEEENSKFLNLKHAGVRSTVTMMTTTTTYMMATTTVMRTFYDDEDDKCDTKRSIERCNDGDDRARGDKARRST